MAKQNKEWHAKYQRLIDEEKHEEAAEMLHKAEKQQAARKARKVLRAHENKLKQEMQRKIKDAHKASGYYKKKPRKTGRFRGFCAP